MLQMNGRSATQRMTVPRIIHDNQWLLAQERMIFAKVMHRTFHSVFYLLETLCFFHLNSLTHTP